MAKDKVGEDGTEQVTEQEIIRPITPGQLKTLLKVRDEARDETAEARKKVNDAIEKLRMEKHVHVDKWALGIVEQLRQIETTEKMADKIDILMYYLDASGLTDKAKKAQRLDLGDSAHRQAPGRDPKVTPIRQQAAE
jgi:hypothetical protein